MLCHYHLLCSLLLSKSKTSFIISCGGSNQFSFFFIISIPALTRQLLLCRKINIFSPPSSHLLYYFFFLSELSCQRLFIYLCIFSLVCFLHLFFSWFFIRSSLLWQDSSSFFHHLLIFSATSSSSLNSFLWQNSSSFSHHLLISSATSSFSLNCFFSVSLFISASSL